MARAPEFKKDITGFTLLAGIHAALQREMAFSLPNNSDILLRTERQMQTENTQSSRRLPDA
jgi:hypothetical protein